VSAWAYNFILSVIGRMGIWVGVVFAWFIAAGYFLFLRRRRRISVRFYRALFPHKGYLHALQHTWGQYQSFARLYWERLLLEKEGAIQKNSEGWEHLIKARESGTGGIILMTHLGSWEIAARLCQRRGLDLLLYVESRQQEHVDRMLKSDVKRDGVKILSAEAGAQGDTLFNGIEGITRLRQGGLISLAGDRTRPGDTQTLTVRLLGHQVNLPRAPYMLALLSGAPLFIFFAVRIAPRKYRIVTTPPIFVRAASRKDRARAMAQAAQDYADLMESILKQYPTQWYAFEPFLGEPWEGEQ